MKKIRFSEEQITYALRQVEGGTPPADVCRQLGCSEASFYIWKKRYGSMGMSEVKELRQLRDENARLKRGSDARQEHPLGGGTKKCMTRPAFARTSSEGVARRSAKMYPAY